MVQQGISQNNAQATLVTRFAIVRNNPIHLTHNIEYKNFGGKVA